MEGLEGPVLDVATGTGDLALELERTEGAGEVVGMDLLEPMVSRATVKGEGRRVSFAMGDALSLPFQDDSFACVTSAFSLRNIPDLEQSLREMARVVRPGGRVLSLETMPVERGLLRPFVKLYFRRVVPLVGAIVAMDMSAYTYLPKSVEGFVSPEELEGVFGGGGGVGWRGVGWRGGWGRCT